MKATIPLALTLAVALGACVAADDETVDTTPAEDITATPPTAQPADLVVATGQFQPVGAAAGTAVSGTAELRRQGTGAGDGLELNVHLVGLTGEEGHAWHVHEGSCESTGAVLIPLSDAGDREGIADDLSADDAGMAEASVEIEGEHLAALSPEGSYSVNVHAGSGASPGAPIACATLQLPADFGPAAGADATASPADGPGL
ncbi:MAG: CHRD domain-containing protein [Gemmatimonadota bacterium]